MDAEIFEHVRTFLHEGLRTPFRENRKQYRRGSFSERTVLNAYLTCGGLFAIGLKGIRIFGTLVPWEK